jgi:diguanylate cyclase (GGDEF)-like protein
MGDRFGPLPLKLGPGRPITMDIQSCDLEGSHTQHMNYNILLVDDDPGSIRVLAAILEGLGKLRFATGGLEALRLARESAPDLILLDAEMPGINGFEVCAALKADPELGQVPVIFITSHKEPSFETAGFEIGAADFIAKPVSPPLVLARVNAQLRFKSMADELRRISKIDGLTGVANRACFDETLSREWLRTRRSGEPLSLLMIDVDHFKLFNDHYGHPAGDDCLRSVAQALARVSRRPADLVARYGGEEFVMLLPATARRDAEQVAYRVLDTVEALAIEHLASPTSKQLTISIGVGCYDEESATWVQPSLRSRLDNALSLCSNFCDLVKAADLALYAAKRGGRDQARLLDIADVLAPSVAHDVAPKLITAHAECSP